MRSHSLNIRKSQIGGVDAQNDFVPTGFGADMRAVSGSRRFAFGSKLSSDVGGAIRGRWHNFGYLPLG